MPMSSAVPCFYCGKSAKSEHYGNCNAVFITCGTCTKANSVVEYKLEDAVKSWNREQKRLTEAHG
jgi:hypothetical protein